MADHVSAYFPLMADHVSSISGILYSHLNLWTCIYALKSISIYLLINAGLLQVAKEPCSKLSGLQYNHEKYATES